MSGTQALPSHRWRPSGRKARAILWQGLALAVLAGGGAWLAINTMSNLEERRIGSGFGFLERPASIPIAETLIAYAPGDANLHAVAVGLLNTLLVTVLGIVLATVLGTVVGVARLSRNWPLARVTGLYIELARNVPITVHLLLWYALLQGLPAARSAISLGGTAFLSNRGLVLPAVGMPGGWLPLLAAVGVAAGLAFALHRLAARRQRWSGRRPLVWPWAAGLLLGLPACALAVQGAWPTVTLPQLKGFNFAGGTTISPELTALTLGLVVYFAAFIAEIVRGGILAVSPGQWEAGVALGLDRRRILRLVVIPQALRLIIPATTNQYLNLTKSSSLAIIIGYPDLVTVINSIITDTGQAIECIGLIMAAFLAVSVSISLLMNWFNSRMKLVER
ncbi:ABC transporter permease subunit [Azospirillum sp. RWY-5-1]|uniref:ABC transporter permease subunit n=1 Tax=Azospirillum oleiclasticum TaxID=2735135 RepID=A0ABX2TG23_9PROT|nr:ABC transporter permease subunit [Azospirillum oleiclasticum]NYZ14366.1 ABC transporter permease subunit [Azospirillum oleiclasticum]NYZ23282.1 ABC transporter permease subunit [Azospirillum oleiclasticum]